jgi:hypothetical protein
MSIAGILLRMCAVTALVLTVAASGCASGDDDSNGDDDDDNSSEDASVRRADSGGGTGDCTACGDGEGCCDGACIDIQSNMSNCGGCGVTCDPETSNACSTGDCVCNFGTACAAGTTCCGTGCKNIDTDPNNCGECGRVCGENGTCAGGACTCAGEECGEGEECCPGGCANTDSDPANCGSCGNNCGDGAACSGGSCMCPFECPPPSPFGGITQCCGDGCFDICNDPGHCGGCAATACESCLFGACDGAGMPNLDCIALPM